MGVDASIKPTIVIAITFFVHSPSKNARIITIIIEFLVLFIHIYDMTSIYMIWHKFTFISYLESLKLKPHTYKFFWRFVGLSYMFLDPLFWAFETSNSSKPQYSLVWYDSIVCVIIDCHEHWCTCTCHWKHWLYISCSCIMFVHLFSVYSNFLESLTRSSLSFEPGEGQQIPMVICLW